MQDFGTKIDLPSAAMASGVESAHSVSAVWVILTSILSSGVVAAVISSAVAEEKERLVLRRSKIEEIFIDGASWSREIEITFMSLLPVCTGEITYNSYLDGLLERGETAKETGLKQLRMNMNISMYEPGLLPHLKEMEARQSQVNRLQARIKESIQTSGQAREFSKAYRDALLRYGSETDALKESIIRRGAEIASERGTVNGLLHSGFTRAMNLKMAVVDKVRAYRGVGSQPDP